MTAIARTPQNRNFLSPLNFQFQLKRAPNVEFFIQQVNLAGISLPSPNIGNEYVTTPYPGEHLTYDPLVIEFKVDEDLMNYLEIHNWMTGLGKPYSYEQYRDLSLNPDITGESIYSDISLLIQNSSKLSNYEITYIDAFPVKIGSLQFKSTDTDVKYITATTVFKYTRYTITSL